MIPRSFNLANGSLTMKSTGISMYLNVKVGVIISYPFYGRKSWLELVPLESVFANI